MKDIKEFMKAFALVIGLANTLIILWTFYNIYITDGHFIKAEVMVGEPNMFILIPEIAITIYGAIFLSLILFKDHSANIGRIQI